MSEDDTTLRIGELARRIGVSPEALRAWERRYGLLRPERTPAGYRLYGGGDLARARRMRELIDEGWAAGEAARAVVGGAVATGAPPPPASAEPDLPALAVLLKQALLDFDAEDAESVLDRLLAAHALDDVLRDAILPVLREIGDDWSVGAASVAQEHFASQLLGGRMRTLARGWDAGEGPLALLACPSAEHHDLGLLSCGLAMRERGWRIAYLGADTPATALRDAIAATRPAAVVIGVLQSEPLARAVPGLAALAGGVAMLIGGAGAADTLVELIGARRLGGDPVSAAGEVGTPS